ncbi:MARVEL domain-containing protein 3 [Phaethornis superciliosus]
MAANLTGQQKNKTPPEEAVGRERGDIRQLLRDQVRRERLTPPSGGAVHCPREGPAWAQARRGRRRPKSSQPVARARTAPALAPSRVFRGSARPSASSAGGVGPGRAMAVRSSPRGPRTERTGATGRAMSGAGPEEPPRIHAAVPGLLECYGCQYLCTDRAFCQAAQALLALLILVCGSVSCGSTGGYTGLLDLGAIYYYHYGGAYSGFSGTDGEKAQQLDQRFYQLKLPIGRAVMAVGGCLLVFSCVLVLVGILRLPWHFPAWLLLECILDVLVAMGLVPALYYFFHFLLGAYSSSVCKEREQLYQSKGYQGFRCSLHGAEIAVGLFGCIVGVAFLLSAGLAVRGFRIVYNLKQKPVQLYKL